MDVIQGGLEAVYAWALPASGALLCLYPFFLLAWTVAEGRRAVQAHLVSGNECNYDDSSCTKGVAKAHRRRIVLPTLVAALVVCAIAAFAWIAGVAFTTSTVVLPQGQGVSPAMSVASPLRKDVLDNSVTAKDHAVTVDSNAQPWTFGCCVFGSLGLLALAARPSGLTRSGRKARARAIGVAGSALHAGHYRHKGNVMRLRNRSNAHVEEMKALPSVSTVPRFVAPKPIAGVSLWHDVQLRVKTWLNEDADLFRYVNEMPLGSLQKFEVQPHVANNAIEEDPKGSARLAAFGQPVPFNYGCFPQTYRDPRERDEVFNAPGDDDPLDVLDVGEGSADVGAVIRCRPLGAVCLMDEGQADWKIIAVNVDGPGPLASARSVEDVERISPGRIAKCLKWIDDLKKSSGDDEATLHYQIYSIEHALSLLKKDHMSWRKLVEEAGPDGLARGHWIRPPNGSTEEQQRVGRTQVLKLGLAPPSTVPGRFSSSGSSLLAGASRVAIVAQVRALGRAFGLPGLGSTSRSPHPGRFQHSFQRGYSP